MLKRPFAILVAMLLVANGASGIDRATFSLTLPNGWKEDVSDSDYDPERHLFFENKESCVVFLFVRDRGTGFSQERLFESLVEEQRKRMKRGKETSFTAYGAYDGKGVELSGRFYGVFKSTVRVIVFETNTRLVAVGEIAMQEDWKRYRTDFETIRRTLVIKEAVGSTPE